MSMHKAIKRLLVTHGLVGEFQSHGEVSCCIEIGGHLPLSIERIDMAMSIMHHYEHNGDLIRDPEISFAITSKEDLFATAWLPLHMTMDPTEKFYDVYPTINGVMCYDKKMAREINAFSSIWSRNILMQGYNSITAATKVAIS